MKISEIIQIDATIIAGILILLTITSITQPVTPPNAQPIRLNPGLILITWGIIVPFSISALFAIKSEQKRLDAKQYDETLDQNLKDSLTWMKAGFVYLLVFLSIFMFKIVFLSGL